MPASAPIGGKPASPPSNLGLTGSLYARAARQAGVPVTVDDLAAREHDRIDRSRRLSEWVADPAGVYARDILPIWTQVFDEFLDKVIAGMAHPDSLAALRAMVQALDASHTLGVRSLDRWMQARAVQGVKVGLDEATKVTNG